MKWDETETLDIGLAIIVYSFIFDCGILWDLYNVNYGRSVGEFEFCKLIIFYLYFFKLIL
jgi:hypothetical protein